MRADPESARIFLEQGEIPEEFSLIRQPQLAKTLKLLAAKGLLSLDLITRYFRHPMYQNPTLSLQTSSLSLNTFLTIKALKRVNKNLRHFFSKGM